jgi:hypothetical protein
MTARILLFPLPQEPIRLAMPQVHLINLNWLLIALLVLNFAIVIGVGVAAWRFFHG